MARPSKSRRGVVKLTSSTSSTSFASLSIRSFAPRMRCRSTCLWKLYQDVQLPAPFVSHTSSSWCRNRSRARADLSPLALLPRSPESLHHGQPRPTQPTCTYEDPPTSSSQSHERFASTSAREASSSTPYIAPSSTNSSAVEPNALELRVQQLEQMIKAGVRGGIQEAVGLPSTTWSEGNLYPQSIGGGGGGAPVGVASSSISSSSFFAAAGGNQFGADLPSRVLPPPTSYYSSEDSSTFPPLGPSSETSSAYFPPSPPPPDNHLQHHPYHRTMTEPGRISFPHPSLTARYLAQLLPQPQPQPQAQPIPTWPFGASSSSSSHSYSTSPSWFASETNHPAPSPSTFSAPTSTHDSSSNFFSTPEEERRAEKERRKHSVGENVGAALTEQSTVGDDGGFVGFEMENAGVEVAQDAGLLDSDAAQFLRDLLWPGYVSFLSLRLISLFHDTYVHLSPRNRWPAHLPCPTKLEHMFVASFVPLWSSSPPADFDLSFDSIETFFNFVPWSTHVLNKDRFLARMSLPPRNAGFPHPGWFLPSPLPFPPFYLFPLTSYPFSYHHVSPLPLPFFFSLSQPSSTPSVPSPPVSSADSISSLLKFPSIPSTEESPQENETIWTMC